MTKLEALHDERKAWMTPLHDAAPELLEALIGLLEYHRRDNYIGVAKRCQAAAEAAIAKATGVQS